MLLGLSALALASCGGSAESTRNRAEYVAWKHSQTNESSRDSCPAVACQCPTPKPCPKPPDLRALGLPAGIDTSRWIKLDSLTKSLHDPLGGILGAVVVRVRDSAVVWKRYPDLRILPASTMKVLTVAAALEDLGPEFRWKTQLWATGPIRAGVLHGDLVIEGGGDPTFGTDGAGMGPLVAAVSRAGIRMIQGSLVALDTLTGRDEAVWPSGWSIGNSRDGYGAPVTGLNWAQNRTAARSIAEPRRLTLSVLAKSLEARKIRFSGTDTTLLVRGDNPPDRRSWQLLGKVQSPRLSEVLRICLVHSVNPYAEASVLAMGARRSAPRYAPREQGLRRCRQILTTLSVPSAVFVDDGSGLSRYDLVTARAMADLLRRDLGRPTGLRVTDLMPVGGEGTLRFRFGSLPDPSWVVAKTGTLNGTSCLVGVLRIPGRDTLAFALLSTGFQGSARAIRGFQDRLIMALAGIDPPPSPDSIAVADSLSPDDEEPSTGAPLEAPPRDPTPPDSLRQNPSGTSPLPLVDSILGTEQKAPGGPSATPPPPDTAQTVRDPAPDPSAYVPALPLPPDTISHAAATPPADSASGLDSLGTPDSLPGIANDSSSPPSERFDSLNPLQTTPSAPTSEPARDSASPIVPSGTDPDKVNP